MKIYKIRAVVYSKWDDEPWIDETHYFSSKRKANVWMKARKDENKDFNFTRTEIEVE
jgi:hypothetical protein